MDSIFIHSFIYNGSIPGGQNSSKRQTVFFLPIDSRDKEHKDPEKIDLNVPRHAQYLHNAWKKHQDAVYWVDVNLAIRKGYWHSIRLDRMQSSFKKHFQLIVFPKVVRLNWRSPIWKSIHVTSTSANDLTKARMDKRIGSESCSTSKRRSCSTTIRENCSTTIRENCSTNKFSNQPNQLQIQFVTDRGDMITCKMEETRPVLKRSMLILFAKNSVLQMERGDLLKRISMLSRLMTEQGDLLLIQLQHKTILKYVMKAIRSTLMMKYFVKEWKNPLLFMTKIMNRWWWTRHTSTSEFQDYLIPLWNTRKVPAFDNWSRKLRTTQIDMLFKKIYNRINHLIFFSPESKQITRDGTQKTQCKVCLSYWDIGIVYCTCGHFLQKERGVNQQFIKYTMDLLSVPEYVIKKGRLHGHRNGKKPGDKEYRTANQLKKKCKKKYFQGIHDRFIRDLEFRNRMIENNRDEVCRRWDALADEDHTHHLTPEEYSHYKSNWWLRFKQDRFQYCASAAQIWLQTSICLPCSNWKRKMELKEINNGHRVLLLLHGGVGKVPGGLLIPLKVTMEMNQVLTERCDLLYNSSGHDFLEFIYFVTDGSFPADVGLL